MSRAESLVKVNLCWSRVLVAEKGPAKLLKIT
jgi:hypothetical protein